ncbi:MAG: trigger factor [Dehalococcoidales bacterium]|nr:trigger factor [Dehalococcoidales bacterium]
MKVTLDKTENRMSYLTVETDPSEIEEYMNKAYQRIVKNSEVPGFRKGNAPRDILEKHIGREKLIEEAINEMVPITCSKVIEEQKLEPVMQPMVKMIQKEPLVFEMVVPLKPIVELGDYHSLQIEPDSLEVKKEEIDEVLENLRIQFVNYTMVDRPVKEGDIITVDIEGIVLESPIIRNKGVKFQVTPEFSPEIPNLYEHMIGINKDEEKEFKLKLPDDYPGKVVAGKEVSFKVKVHDIQETMLPELNDEFAQKIAPDIKTLDLLKERIEMNMKIERERNAESKFEEKVVEALIAQSKLEYPPIMIDVEARNLISGYMQQMQASCRDEREYEEKMKQMPEAKLKEQAIPMAKKRLMWSLVVYEVAKTEGVQVDNEEVNVEIEHIISDSNDQKDESREYLRDYQNRQNVSDMLRARKTIRKLVEIVKSSNK